MNTSYITQCDTSLHNTSQNEKVLHDISLLSSVEKLNLSSWGLPQLILEHYASRGIVSMFPWQLQCLDNAQVLDGGNIVYSAPTSAGKTLVAELLMIKTVLELKKKAIMILPYVAVVAEKLSYFRDLLSSSGVRVEGLMGNRTLAGGFKSVDIAICTIEKANSLVNRMLEDKSLGDVGVIVVDELHMIGDSFRGYLLELMLSKIKYMCRNNLDIKIQIIGMSATLPNLQLLADWLHGVVYLTDFRPVPLNEFYKCGNTVYDKHSNKLYDIQPEKRIKNDTDHVVQLCLETVFDGHSVLVFCPTKAWVESLAVLIAFNVFNIANVDDEMGAKLRAQFDVDRIAVTKEQLKHCTAGLDRDLEKAVSYGVGFHHAGMTLEERNIVESSFRRGVLRILVATATLSSGVNLPARRVIVRSPLFQGQPMEIQQYQQMIGRAGRTGQDSVGESILIAKTAERIASRKLIEGQVAPVRSCLGGEMSPGLKRALLEVIASGVASTPRQLKDFSSCTLLATQQESTHLEALPLDDEECGLLNAIELCVRYLEKSELIRIEVTTDAAEQCDGQRYEATALGRACLAASMHPDEGLTLFKELQTARQSLVLENDLHIIYQVTPYSVAKQMGNLFWLNVFKVWERLPSDESRVGRLVGMQDSFLAQSANDERFAGQARNAGIVAVAQRFYTALALQDLVREVPLSEVATKFCCSRGLLQALQLSAATYAGMVRAFCRCLNYSGLELLVELFQDRLEFGVQRELVDLLRCEALDRQRARALYEKNIKTVADIVVATPADVQAALRSIGAFQSEKEASQPVCLIGQQTLSEHETALLIIKQAKTLLEYELAVAQARLKPNERISSNNPVDTNTSSASLNANTVTCLTRTVHRASSQDPSLQDLHNTSCSANNSSRIMKKNTELIPLSASPSTSSNHDISETNFEIVNTSQNNSVNLEQHFIGKESNKSVISLHDNSTCNVHDESIRSPSASTRDNKSAVVLTQLNGSTGIHASAVFATELLRAGLNESALFAAVNSAEMQQFEQKTPSIVGRTLGPKHFFANSTPNTSNISPSIFLANFEPNKSNESPGFESPVDIKRIEKNHESKANASTTHSLDMFAGDDSSYFLVCSEHDVKESMAYEENLPPRSMFEDSYIPSSAPDSDNIRASKRSLDSELPTSCSKRVKIDDSFMNINSEMFMDFSMLPDKSKIVSPPPEVINNIPVSLPNEIEDSNEVSTIVHTTSSNSKAGQSDEDKTDAKTVSSTDDKTYLDTKSSEPTSDQDVLEKTDEEIDIRSVRRKKRKVQHLLNSLKHSPRRSKRVIEKKCKDIVQEQDNLLCDTVINPAAVCPDYNADVPRDTNRLSGPDFIDVTDDEEEQVKMHKLGKSMAKMNTQMFRSRLRNGSNKSKLLIKADKRFGIGKPAGSKEEITNPELTKLESSVLSILRVLDCSECWQNFNILEKKLETMNSVAMSLCVEEMSRQGGNIGRAILGRRMQEKSPDKIITGFTLCFGGVEVFYVPLNDSQQEVPWARRRTLLVDLVSGKRVLTICGAATQIKMLFWYMNLSVTAPIIDPLVAEWLLNPPLSSNVNLFALVCMHCSLDAQLLTLVGLMKNGSCSSSPWLKQCVDVVCSWHVFDKLKAKLHAAHLTDVFHNVEMAVVPILARMDLRGLCVSQQASRDIFDQLATLSVSSDARLVAYSNTLRKVLVGLGNGTVHTSSVTNTSTGRIVTHSPNIQCIPDSNKISVLDPRFSHRISVRSVICAPKGQVLVSADFCQLELRILSHLSADERLIEAFKQNGDVFCQMAANWLNCSLNEVTDLQRLQTKHACYGIIYGMGSRVLGDKLEVDEEHAEEIMERFKKGFPDVASFIRKLLADCTARGYIETINKRRRYLPEILSNNSASRSNAERRAINTTIQGSAADIFKQAMILLDKQLKHGQLVMHIHDELICQVDEASWRETALLVKLCMENAVELKVPLPVKMQMGTTWGNLSPVNIDL